MRYAIAVVCLLLLPTVSFGDEGTVLRFGTIVPEGSYWSRELHSFAAKVEQLTNGHVKMKFYFNAVVGDEPETIERSRRGQLDGAIVSAACQNVAPSLRIGRLPGMFQDREEANHVMSRLQPTLEAEAHRSGFVLPGTSAMGADTIFTRVPVHNMAELRKLRMWAWDIDDVGLAGKRAMGFNMVPLPLWDAGRAYDEGRVDGFFVVPSAALVFQLSTRARYLSDLRQGYIWGCPLISEKSFQALSIADQNAIRVGIAILRERTGALARQMDDALIGGLFKKQGVVPVPVSNSFRAEFFAAARTARDSVAPQFVDKQVLERVTQMLADYRAEHGNSASTK